VTNLQEWIAPVWYGDYTAIKNQTNMTQAQLDIFYGTTEDHSFGKWLNDTLSWNYNKYTCPSAKD